MYVTISDAVYWYEWNGNGEPVVLLHGFTGSSRTWDSLITDWLPDFKTIAIDLPGHGKTVSQPKDMEAVCSDLVSLLDQLQLDKVHLIGYSMGGRTALSMAMLYPDRVMSLTLESASPGLNDEQQRSSRRHQDEKLASWIKTNGINTFVDYWEGLPLFRTQKTMPKDVQQRIRNERLQQSAEGLAQSLMTMGTGVQPSWWGGLSSLRLPVLLLVGEEDAKFITINRAMEAYIPASDLHVVENAGHAIHVEQPNIFGKIVKGFLQSINKH
ncbi:2-succinyl-6-hydroxy-2,4-cyclohexadiene-1-carboxylate synthase [Lentibacillus cibarius]|uniref:Putative 2-succinyl-6-hydroxy-2,4-cyclohexadiene-1-carboxylate synthase n=1 Tax=Lentibacillus cibarius TaxID=2583219 RepID=A0A549YMB5_9BACI|nr:2-succinyl-6-hydroxy-2,4-cyclohexadiene-1-carboxylate synthase [Lentibacillus cibarius]TRM13016.1 2-succinyl-6-hydroxy-2,4-cyclohexadiene-1-carboxylate synthase [Lentibacillus cibarius]